jgi:hypothetical protein
LYKKKARSGVLRALGVRGLKGLSALTRAKDSVDTALLFLCLALCVVEQLMERLKFVVYACEVDLLILILCIFHCSKILKVKKLVAERVCFAHILRYDKRIPTRTVNA